MTADLFRRHIDGRCGAGGGAVCRHCRKFGKREAAHLARARLKAATRQEIDEDTEPEKEAP